MNNFNFTGGLTKDPETRQTNGGTTVANMRIANDKPKRNGEEQDPNYFTVVAFGKLADVCLQYLEKGRQVAVSGRIEYREWETKEGEKRSTYEVIADNIDFLSSGKGAGSTTEPEEVPAF